MGNKNTKSQHENFHIVGTELRGSNILEADNFQSMFFSAVENRKESGVTKKKNNSNRNLQVSEVYSDKFGKEEIQTLEADSRDEKNIMYHV